MLDDVCLFCQYFSNKLYAIEMLETSPLSWAVVCFLVVLNYFRISLHFHCHVDDHRDDDNHDDDNHRLLEEGDDGAELVISEHCAEYTTDYFLLCGFLLVVFGLLVSALTWRSKVHLMEVSTVGGNNVNKLDVALLLLSALSMCMIVVYSLPEICDHILFVSRLLLGMTNPIMK